MDLQGDTLHSYSINNVVFFFFFVKPIIQFPKRRRSGGRRRRPLPASVVLLNGEDAVANNTNGLDSANDNNQQPPDDFSRSPWTEEAASAGNKTSRSRRLKFADRDHEQSEAYRAYRRLRNRQQGNRVEGEELKSEPESGREKEAGAGRTRRDAAPFL
jgi:hypothetical protein